MTMENETALSGADDAALFAEITSGNPVEKTMDPPETATPEIKAEAPQPVAPQIEQPQEQARPQVPLAELIEERKARQNLERQISELTAAMRANAPKPEPKPAPEWYDKPDEFVRYTVEPELQRQNEALMYNARLVAEARFGDQIVTEAITNFDALLTAGKLHPADHAKVMNSPNPFAEAVKWHQSNKIVSEIGTDPTAYKQKLRAELMNDPEFRKEFMAQMQQQARSAPLSAGTPVSLPSLSKVGASAMPSNDGADLDDGQLWASVTSSKRRA